MKERKRKREKYAEKVQYNMINGNLKRQQSSQSAWLVERREGCVEQKKKVKNMCGMLKSNEVRREGMR